ncbi:hypothetical protein INR77_07090 [Erythrobacter sp. SCSIO 43205]|uniref:hypothetical protein n=1 Tax=Erythrobacter sp. SCSIO 43205 TaxID=2779361 RepID=UPI001CA803D1|nr:hypothetical protein [Erythrobacter sp. SCSIO 43205]UAB79424.1 hypothetical protein INR77_07090 [Erythrobacter sp. SCSIO 43205]
MKFAKMALLATVFAATPIAANAQDVGTTVYGNDDAPIGTVLSNDGTTAVVDTGKHEAPLPANLLAEREGKWTVNATKAQIDGMMDQQVAQAEAAAKAQAAAEAEAAAKLDAAIAVGTPVITADAQPLGTISELMDSNVVVENDEVGLVTLPRDFFALDANDELVARANLADIMAAVQGG